MADILYNYGQIDQAVADMRAGVNKLNTKLEDMQSSWDGQAKRAYDASKAKWTEGMDGIVEILTGVAAAVAEARQSAQATDARNADGFGS